MKKNFELKLSENYFFIFVLYAIFISFISFYDNPFTTSFADPYVFFQHISGDCLKFVKLAKLSLEKGFCSPASHCPGLQVINIILLWIHPHFPVIVFLTGLNILLWSTLFALLYYLGRQKTNSLISFLAPFTLIIPSFAHFYFLRELGIALGTSFTAVLPCISCVLIIIGAQQHKLLLSGVAGMCLAISGYLWSLSDTVISLGSILFFILTLFYIGCKLISSKRLVFWPLKKSDFPLTTHLSLAFLNFWLLTLPYRIYQKSLSMVDSNVVWQIIWKLPLLLWNMPKHQGTWVSKGGGFLFCNSYPDVCQELHAQPALHNNIAYLKKLTFQTFMSDPLRSLSWKYSFWEKFWVSSYPLENKIILLFFPLTLILFFIRPNKMNSILVVFAVGIFFITFSILFLTHIELRYFYNLKFFLCFAGLVSIYAFMSNQKARSSPPA
jgi:hypothetical protein